MYIDSLPFGVCTHNAAA